MSVNTWRSGPDICSLICGLKLGVWVWSKVLSRLISRGTLNSQEIERIYYQTAVQGICTLELHIALLNCTMHYGRKNGILLPKLFWPTVRKNCSSDREKLLKFEAEVRELTKFFKSLEQFIRTVKGENNFWNRMLV